MEVGRKVIKVMSFRIFSKPLMKWREPKVKGWVTPTNVLTFLISFAVLAIPFAFLLSGSRGFSVPIYVLAFGSMSGAVVLGLVVARFLPGDQMRLTEHAIVRVMERRRQRSAYKDIDRCYYYRDCSYVTDEGEPIIKVHGENVGGPKFTSFEVIMKNERIVSGEREFSFASLRSVGRFAVPEDVDLDQVLQILREKGVNVFEGTWPQ
jgi:hypothetical protein